MLRLTVLRLTALGLCAAAVAACGSKATRTETPTAPVQTSAPKRVAGGDWTRFGYTAQRSGVGPGATGITGHDVSSLRRRAVHIDGAADSSAIEVHAVRVRGRRRDIAVATTTYGRTIAFDPGTGEKLWEYVPPDIGAYQGSHQITTATPVLDPARQHLYAASPDGLIRKLSVATGHEVRVGGWPARITFDSVREKIAAALNLSGRYVVAVTGGYFGDAPAYQGHVVLIDRGSGRIAHVWNSLCADRHDLIDPPSACPASDSAIWGRAGAVIEPGTGKILVATGNGPYDGSADWGDSVLELSPDADALLQSWTPANQARLEASDTDVGSTGPALLPASGGLHLAVQGGKDGNLYLLNLDRLNGTTHAARRLGGQLQSIPAPGGGEVMSAPAVWSHGGRTYVFVANANGTSAYVLGGGQQPRLGLAWNRGSGGTSPIVAGGLLYVYDPGAGTLNVRMPTTGALVKALDAQDGHWNSPIVIGGRIILPVGGSTADNDTSGTIYIYHLPHR